MAQHDARLVGGIYLLGQTLSKKGILTTCSAYNRNTNDVVGLSLIDIPPTSNPEMLQQFLQPLGRRRMLQSPHVIHVYDWGIEGTRIYIVTDPPRGVTLRYVLDNEDFDLQRALDISRQLAHGLKALHECGLAGLDLRPPLITIDTVDVTDRVQIDDIGLRTLFSALAYMNYLQNSDIEYFDSRYAPPEYIKNGQVGPWSDVYQVGILFFEMVTGRVPFVGRNNAETGILQSTSPIPTMNQYKHNTPESFQHVVEHMLAKDPAQRFPGADALVAALEGIQLPSRLTGSSTTAQSSPFVQPNGNLTSEMPPLQEDVTLRPTLSEGIPPAGPESVLPTEEGVFAYLYLYSDKEEEETPRIAIKDNNVVIGRTDPKHGLSPDIDLSPFDTRMTISRQHARIRFEETFFYIEDLKSRNKTRLNTLVLTPLQPQLLQHGDVITFGSVRMVFKIPGMKYVPIFKNKQ